ncbi:MAG TPA: cytochrome c [Chloroflexota bacterium]|nr:cytochrome c [Chloroflexota bacterium]
MSLPAWLRFAELSLLAGWLAWRLYQPRAGRASQALLPLLAMGLAAAQFVLEGQAATDPFTPLIQVMPTLLGSAYGGLSVTAIVLAPALAVWVWRRPQSGWPATTAVMAALLVIAGGVSVTTAGAVSAAQSSGEIAMSPTLAVPRNATTTPNPYASDASSAERGRAVYQQYCVTCHGLNGDGNGPAIAGLRIRPPSFHNPQHFLAPGMDGAHFWVIQHGDGQSGGMPAWEGTLTPQQMWDVLDYIKTIAAGTSNALPPAPGGRPPPTGPTASLGSFRPGG